MKTDIPTEETSWNIGSLEGGGTEKEFYAWSRILFISSHMFFLLFSYIIITFYLWCSHFRYFSSDKYEPVIHLLKEKWKTKLTKKQLEKLQSSLLAGVQTKLQWPYVHEILIFQPDYKKQNTTLRANGKVTFQHTELKR